MPMIRSDLGRAFTMSVCANGSVWIQRHGQIESGTLPVFSTDTHDQAEQIRVRHCRRAQNGSGLYFLNDPPPQEVGRAQEFLGGVSDLFRKTYEQIQGEATAAADAAMRDPKVRRAALDILDRIEKAGESEEADDSSAVRVNDLREGLGTHHPRVRVMAIDDDGDADCILIRSGNRKTVRVVTLSKAYRLIQRDYGPPVAT